MNKIKVAVASYQNTIPFLYGLLHSDKNLNASLLLSPPFECANNLQNNKVDIALIPAVKLLEFPEVRIFSKYCISAKRDVASVALFSDNKINEINTIYLDKESRTSVELIKILAKEYWKINVKWKELEDISTLQSGEACMLIGDKVFEHEDKFSIKYDLATEWNDYTGKPFVFALWVAKQNIPAEFEQDFNYALEFGTKRIEQSIARYGSKEISYDDLYYYLSKNIEFDLTEDKLDGLKLFLSKVKEPSSH